MTPGQGPADSPRYGVAIIGAGPAGCEAALAAAAAGARTLCLTINLDTVGYPTATPVIIDDSDDRRHQLLAELAELGGNLPRLLMVEGIASSNGVEGRILADRRRLGLAWKEALERADGVELRQALVVSLEPGDGCWLLRTKLDEIFTAAAVVVAAGTFLNGRVFDAGREIPGGRWAEIPANSLARTLHALGLDLVEVTGRTSPRLSTRGLESAALADPRLRSEGGGLGEVLGFSLESEGNRCQQLEVVHQQGGLENAWINRASYAVLHLVMAAGQLDKNLEARSAPCPGLFFAGRAAGSCNYTEAAGLGMIAGRNAAVRAGAEEPAVKLTKQHRLVIELLRRIAFKEIRPVTVRIDDETGC